MVGIYEQNPKTVSAIQLTMANWIEAVKFANMDAIPTFRGSNPALEMNDGSTRTAELGDWLIRGEHVGIVVESDPNFRSNYKRRIPRKAKDDAAPAAKKKVKAA